MPLDYYSLVEKVRSETAVEKVLDVRRPWKEAEQVRRAGMLSSPRTLNVFINFSSLRDLRVGNLEWKSFREEKVTRNHSWNIEIPNREDRWYEMCRTIAKTRRRGGRTAEKGARGRKPPASAQQGQKWELHSSGKIQVFNHTCILPRRLLPPSFFPPSHFSSSALYFAVPLHLETFLPFFPFFPPIPTWQECKKGWTGPASLDSTYVRLSPNVKIIIMAKDDCYGGVHSDGNYPSRTS